MTKRGANAAISYMSCAGINQLSNNLQRSVFSLSFFNFLLFDSFDIFKC